MSKNRKKILFLGLFLIINLIFVDFVSAETYNNYSKDVLSCGGGMVTNIPTIIPNVTSTIYTIIQIAIPVVLVIFGSLDLVKGIMASKEDEIKKGQQLLVKRLMAAVSIFFVFALVKFVIGLVADENTEGILGCAECFISKNGCEHGDEIVCDVNGYIITYSKDGKYKSLGGLYNSEVSGDITHEYYPKTQSDCSKIGIELTQREFPSYVYDVRIYDKTQK